MSETLSICTKFNQNFYVSCNMDYCTTIYYYKFLLHPKLLLQIYRSNEYYFKFYYSVSHVVSEVSWKFLELHLKIAIFKLKKLIKTFDFFFYMKVHILLNICDIYKNTIQIWQRKCSKRCKISKSVVFFCYSCNQKIYSFFHFVQKLTFNYIFTGKCFLSLVEIRKQIFSYLFLY